MTHLHPTDLLTADAFVTALRRDLPGLVVTQSDGDWFVFHDPDGVTREDSRFPFCTVVTGDRYDDVSRLDRDAAAFRVNLGVSRATYERLLGPAPRQPAGHGVVETGHDYALVDTVLPHPVYCPLHWVCVVSPGAATLDELDALVDDARATARRTYDNQRRRRTP